MQAKLELSQVEKSSFVTLAETGGQQAALKAFLAYKGVTNGSLSEALGVSPSMISKIKSGRDVSRPCVLKLRALGVPEPLLPQPAYLPPLPEAA